jgi:hypothetical protein
LNRLDAAQECDATVVESSNKRRLTKHLIIKKV